MKQFLCVFNVTKTRFFVLALLLVFVTKPKAQIDVPIGNSTVGNTTTTYPKPMQDLFEGNDEEIFEKVRGSKKLIYAIQHLVSAYYHFDLFESKYPEISKMI